MTLPESIKERVLTMGAEARRLGTTGALIGTFASGPELNFFPHRPDLYARTEKCSFKLNLASRTAK